MGDEADEFAQPQNPYEDLDDTSQYRCPKHIFGSMLKHEIHQYYSHGTRGSADHSRLAADESRDESKDKSGVEAHLR